MGCTLSPPKGCDSSLKGSITSVVKSGGSAHPPPIREVTDALHVTMRNKGSEGVALSMWNLRQSS